MFFFLSNRSGHRVGFFRSCKMIRRGRILMTVVEKHYGDGGGRAHAKLILYIIKFMSVSIYFVLLKYYIFFFIYALRKQVGVYIPTSRKSFQFSRITVRRDVSLYGTRVTDLVQTNIFHGGFKYRSENQPIIS